MLFLVSKLNWINLHDHNCLFANRSTRRILQFYLHRVKNILRFFGLHVSSSVAHFVWKMKQFEFHIFFTVRDIKATAERHISRTWKRRFTLCFWGLNNQCVERSEKNCNLRETKSFDIAKINCGRHVCLPQGGINVVAAYLACVAWRFLSGETAITNPKVARSLGERKLRNRLQGWPAFFVSPVRWRTGHFHWLRRRARQSQFPKGHLYGTAMITIRITMKIFGLQVKKSFPNMQVSRNC